MINIIDLFESHAPAPAKAAPSAFAKDYLAALRKIIAGDEQAANMRLNTVSRHLEKSPEKEGAIDRLVKDTLRSGMLGKLYGDDGNKTGTPWIKDVTTVATIGAHVIMLGGTKADQAAYQELTEKTRETFTPGTTNMIRPNFGG